MSYGSIGLAPRCTDSWTVSGGSNNEPRELRFMSHLAGCEGWQPRLDSYMERDALARFRATKQNAAGVGLGCAAGRTKPRDRRRVAAGASAVWRATQLSEAEYDPTLQR